jgi:prepilin-type N-terminal cleavage/methylation domain-containing protein/prepilin-type processing-associated H-X9-DG protein
LTRHFLKTASLRLIPIHRPSGASNGFTLIELLVVVAVISTLAAILFPVFQTVREKASQTVCMSNAKQIALAFQLYEDDFDGRTPFTNPGPPRWPNVMESYLKASPQITWCPNDNQNWPGYPRSPDGGGIGDYLFGLCPDYGYNEKFLSLNPPCQIGPPFTCSSSNESGEPLSAVTQPAHTLLLVESTYAKSGPAGKDFIYGFHRVEPPPLWTGTGSGVTAESYGYCWPRHQGRATSVFVDGHVKALTISQISDPTLWSLEGGA